MTVLLGALFAFACIGCGDDVHDRILDQIFQVLTNTTRDIDTVAKTLNDAVAQAKNDKKPLDLAKIAEAQKQASELKQKAKDLGKIKDIAENRSEGVTPEQQGKYADNRKSNLIAALVELDAAQKRLDTALREADAVADAEGKAALEKLRDTLKEAQNEFEVLTKRQS
jgi:hypothetical protein